VTTADVFVNCPFDSEYRPAFEALIFTITASGYNVRCALEEDDSANIRHDKLCRLIRESDRSIHDLSHDRAGQHSIRINDQWRVCFVWTGKDAENVEIVDYH
jgi:hypothetical protein